MLNTKELNNFVKLVYKMNKLQRNQARCWLQGVEKYGFHKDVLKLAELAKISRISGGSLKMGKYEFKPRTSKKIKIEAYNFEQALKIYTDSFILKGKVD